jgi:hypothetical protein
MVPQSGPRVVQVDAAPAAAQGRSATYTSGLSFSLSGGVEVSGDGPSAGLQAGITWDRSVSTDVPPLMVEAGNQAVHGAFTRYRYCTIGDSVQNCVSTIQMVGPGICQRWIVGDPQNGQTPNGRLSGVAQTVIWQVDPATYIGDEFEITVTFQAELATSTSRLWNSPTNIQGLGVGAPWGSCNAFGCNCGIDTEVHRPAKVSQTFKVKVPSRQCSS